MFYRPFNQYGYIRQTERWLQNICTDRYINTHSTHFLFLMLFLLLVVVVVVVVLLSSNFKLVPVSKLVFLRPVNRCGYIKAKLVPDLTHIQYITPPCFHAFPSSCSSHVPSSHEFISKGDYHSHCCGNVISRGNQWLIICY